MTTIRRFINTPMLDTESDAADYFAAVPVISCAGYIGPDGTRRMLVEVALDCAADDMADEAARIETEAKKLRDAAERIRT